MTLETPQPAIVQGSSLDRFWEALDRGGYRPEKIRGNKFMALCPVHGDTNRSLSVKWADGKVLLHCFTCDRVDVHTVTGAVGMTPTDLFDAPLPPREERKTRRTPAKPRTPAHKVPPRITSEPSTAVPDGAKWDRVKTYDYADVDGRVMQQVHREVTVVDGTPHKRFTQQFRGPSGRMVSRKPDGFAPVLFRHRAVVDAIASGRPVWLLEGEKDVENAEAAGLVATTNAQGASSFPEELAGIFAGATVNVVADRDTAGFHRAVQLHELLSAQGAKVTLLLPAIEDTKADLTDHLDAGHGVDELVRISAADAALCARLGEAKRAMSMLEVCRKEISAHLAATDGEPNHLLAIEAWAKESQLRFTRLLEVAGETPLADAADGPEGRAAIAGIQKLVLEAATLTAAAHSSADLSLPYFVRDRLSPEDRQPQGAPVKPNRVITLGGGEPPVFDGTAPASFDDDGKANNQGTTYAVRNGETVQVKRERVGEEIVTKYIRIMRGWAEVQSLAVDDDASDDGITRPTSRMVVKFSRWMRDDAGNPLIDDDGRHRLEVEVVTWDADQLRDGSWALSLPWPGMLESASRRGKDTAWDAIFNARPVPTTRRTVYVATGWRESDAGPFFVHAGGAIAKGGSVAVDANIPDQFAPFRLPDPVTDAEGLRQAWIDGTQPLVSSLPARVIAPLLGVVWRSVFEKVPFITHLVGGRAAYKTSTARVACQYFAPDMNYHGRREILSGSNMGGSTIGLIRSLALTSYLPVLIDDVAPDGNAKAAQQKLSTLARMIYNDTGRVVGKQRGGISADKPTKATVITTGELAVSGSGLTRMLTIPLDPGALARGSETFAELERSSSRLARGELGASLIRWIAQYRDDLHAEVQQHADNPGGAGNPLTQWRKRLNDLPHDDGLKDRLSEAAIAADHGIRLMLRMMVSSKAMSKAEANEFYAWAEAGIYEAISMQDSAAGDPAEQLLGYIREALVSGAAHLTQDGRDIPDEPRGYGWVSRGAGDYAQWVPSGQRIGVIKGDRVYLIPSTTLGVANSVASRADESFSETAVSISSAMLAHGWLATDGAAKRSVGRRIDGHLQRVWDVPFAILFGPGDPEPESRSDEPKKPTPTLFDDDLGGSEPTSPEAPLTPAPVVEPATTPAGDEPAATAAATPPATSTTLATPASAPRQPAQRRAPARGSAKRFRAAAAVLHTDGLWMPDGELIGLEQPIEHLGDIATLISTLRLGHMNAWKTEPGQIFATEAAALQLGIPVDQLPQYKATDTLKELTANHPLLTGAIAAGFSVSGRGEPAFNTTTRIWHEGKPDLRGRFVLLSTLKDDFKRMIDDDPSPATIARRLQRFADALGSSYQISASTTGLDLLEVTQSSREKRDLYFEASSPVPPAEISTLEHDIDWQRVPTDEERTHRYVHAYDRGGSYLAGVGGLELGIGAPTYFPEGTAFEARTPGYWRIVMPERAEWLVPNPIDPHNRDEDFAGTETWVTTPTLEIAKHFGYDPTIVEAYVWEKHGRIYDGWYERVRDARTMLDTDDEDDQRARDVLKELYVRTLGLTASFEHHKGRRGFAPERYHLIQARAKANILRRVDQIGRDTGRWPIAISKDTVLYTSNDVDADRAWPGNPAHYGRGLGQFKYEGTAPLEQHLRFFTGRGRYEGKSELERLI